MYTLNKRIYVRIAPIIDFVLRFFNRNIYTNLYNRKFYYDTSTDIGQKIIRVGNFERAELELIRKIVKPNSIIFDIGANIGTHTVPMALQASNTGKIFSFEPSRKTYQFLLKNISGLNNVYPVPMALSDKNGTSTFYNTSDNAYSGLKITGKKPIVATENVITITIDDFVKIQEITRLDFIKIDVEGHEKEVIYGAINTIKNFRPIILVEICKNPKINFNPEDLIKKIAELDYNIFKISGWKVVPFVAVNDTDYNYLFVPKGLDFKI